MLQISKSFEGFHYLWHFKGLNADSVLKLNVSHFEFLCVRVLDLGRRVTWVFAARGLGHWSL